MNRRSFFIGCAFSIIAFVSPPLQAGWWVVIRFFRVRRVVRGFGRFFRATGTVSRSSSAYRYTRVITRKSRARYLRKNCNVSNAKIRAEISKLPQNWSSRSLSPTERLALRKNIQKAVREFDDYKFSKRDKSRLEENLEKFFDTIDTINDLEDLYHVLEEWEYSTLNIDEAREHLHTCHKCEKVYNKLVKGTDLTYLREEFNDEIDRYSENGRLPTYYEEIKVKPNKSFKHRQMKPRKANSSNMGRGF